VHLAELRALYSHISRYKVVNPLYNLRLLAEYKVENPNYPQEDYDAFVTHLIEEKKRIIRQIVSGGD
jgi:hypothetical protein